MQNHNISQLGKRCCGCRSCQYSCPTKAITLSADEEGFFYPQINEESCIRCGKCVRACPVLTPLYMDAKQTGYAAYIRSDEQLRKSTSGGIFYALATDILEQGGVVYGCGTVDGLPQHLRADSASQLDNLRGSKYVQSSMENIYPSVKKDLENNIPVLFSGTPCQVAGLRRFLAKPYDNLLCADIICHGTPSRKMYAEYLEWFGHQKGGKVVDYDFRSKNRNDWSLTYKATVQHKSGHSHCYEAIASLDPYYYAFLQGSTYRESCYTCPYGRIERAGDITLGDFWGIEQVLPEMNNSNGTSAVIVNSADGAAAFERIKHNLIHREVTVAQIRQHNGNLRHASHRPNIRDDIYRDMNDHGFAYIAKRYMTHPKRYVEVIRNLFPNKLRQAIKKIIRH